jgi:hypothetical protein
VTATPECAAWCTDHHSVGDGIEMCTGETHILVRGLSTEEAEWYRRKMTHLGLLEVTSCLATRSP